MKEREREKDALTFLAMPSFDPTAKDDFEQQGFTLAKEIRILFGIVSATHQKKGEYVKLRDELIRKQEEKFKEYQEDYLLF